MGTYIQDDDFLVAYDVDGGSTNDPGIRSYSGRQLRDDILDLLSQNAADVKIYISGTPPPRGPDLKPGDFWFDQTSSHLFVADYNESGSEIVWIVNDPSTSTAFDSIDGNPSDVIRFPEDSVIGDTFVHPKTGVNYKRIANGLAWVMERGNDYMLRDGDTVTGGYKFENATFEVEGTFSVNNSTEDVIKIDNDVVTRGDKTLVYSSATGNSYAFAVYPEGLDNANHNKTALRVTGDGAVKAGDSPSEAFMAQEDNDVATAAYVESVVGDYLPLSGGSLTGAVNTNSVFKTTSAIAFTKSNAEQYIKASDSQWLGIYGYKDASLSNNYSRNIRIKHESTEIRYLVDPSSNGDAANKRYVDQVAAVAVVDHNGSTPPSGKTRGTLLMTNNNKLYLYT